MEQATVESSSGGMATVRQPSSLCHSLGISDFAGSKAAGKEMVQGKGRTIQFQIKMFCFVAAGENASNQGK